MARARNIKPGFFTNDLLGECQPLARLLFQGLWCHADREGRLEDRPKKFKAEILPYDDCDAEILLQELASSGFIVRYQFGGKRYLQVVNFCKHQNPHIKEQASEIPAPELTGACLVQEQECSGSCPADSLSLDSPSLIPSKKHSPEYSDEFESAWAAYPRKGDTNKKQSSKAWTARIKSGVDPGVLLAGVIRYADYCQAMGTENGYIKQPATFFGPDNHFLNDWTVIKGSANGKNGSSRADSLKRAADELTGRHRHTSPVIDGIATRMD